MSDREILIQLEGTGTGECRLCYAQCTDTHVPSCYLYRVYLENVARTGANLRCDACLAAERAAAQLREDAKFKARWERLREWIADGGNLGMVLHQMRKLEKGE